MSSLRELKSGSRRFCRKLRNRGDLFDADPVLRPSFLERANECLASAAILLQHDHPEDAIAMAYYARLNAASALLATTGIRCKSHTGTIMLLRELFGIDEGFAKAKEQRETVQYDPEAIITRTEAKTLLAQAEDFLSLVKDRSERLSETETKQVRHHVLDFN